MAQAGDRLENPATGQTIVFRQTSAQTGGDLLEVETTYQPGSSEPLEHYHPKQEERFEVLEGTVRVRLAGKKRDIRQGDTLVVPARTTHAMWNAGSEPARMLWQTRPALRTESFFEAVWGLAAEGRLTDKGTPGPLQGAVLMREYSDEFRLGKPPAAVQRVLFGLLAPIGRLLGRTRRADKAGA
jgi:quercetin dioxygenase-like cupin family protein